MAPSSESKWLDPSLAIVNNCKAERLTESTTTQSLDLNNGEVENRSPHAGWYNLSH